ICCVSTCRLCLHHRCHLIHHYLNSQYIHSFPTRRSSDLTFSVKVLNLFSRSRRKTNKRKSKHSAMLRNKETRHRMLEAALWPSKIGRAVQQECRDRSRMPSSA